MSLPHDALTLTSHATLIGESMHPDEEFFLFRTEFLNLLFPLPHDAFALIDV